MCILVATLNNLLSVIVLLYPIVWGVGRVILLAIEQNLEGQPYRFVIRVHSVCPLLLFRVHTLNLFKAFYTTSRTRNLITFFNEMVEVV